MSDESPAYVPVEVAKQLAGYQERMAKALDILTEEERLQMARTVIVQQAMLIHSVDQLTTTMKELAERYEVTIQRLNAAFMSLIKVPIATVIIGAASWAYLYSKVISENTWLIMMGVAAFPWLGESITAISKIIRGSGNGEKK